VTVVEILPHDLAVVAAIETAGKPVGLAEAPDGALEALTETDDGPDYVILYPISGLRSPISLVDATGDVELVYQTTIVARRPEGARYLIDKIETALLEVAVDGRHVVRVTADEVGQVRPDTDLTPHVYLATPRWRLWTTPNA
jgi:hypothetical protein